MVVVSSSDCFNDRNEVVSSILVNPFLAILVQIVSGAIKCTNVADKTHDRSNKHLIAPGYMDVGRGTWDVVRGTEYCRNIGSD